MNEQTSQSDLPGRRVTVSGAELAELVRIGNLLAERCAWDALVERWEAANAALARTVDDGGLTVWR